MGTSHDAASMEEFFRTGGRTEKTPEQRAAELVGWYDATLGASHWFAMPAVAPTPAAMLLCQQDPNSVDAERVKFITTDATTPDDFICLQQRIEAEAMVRPLHRTLLHWLEFARASKLRYHPWIDEYVEAAGLDVGAPGVNASGHATALAAAQDPAGRTLKTGELAEAFDGIDGVGADKWRQWLGDLKNHSWLKPARATIGMAPNPATWWPLKFAELLLERGRPADSLNRAFLTVQALKPWLHDWQEARRERDAFGQ